jgi:hypothetical protein
MLHNIGNKTMEKKFIEMLITKNLYSLWEDAVNDVNDDDDDNNDTNKSDKIVAELQNKQLTASAGGRRKKKRSTRRKKRRGKKTRKYSNWQMIFDQVL